MTRRKAKDEVLQIRLTARDKARLERLARRRNRTLTDVIWSAVERELVEAA